MNSNFLDSLTKEEMLPILDSITDAVFIDSSDGTSLWCNKESYKLYNVKPEQISGIHVSELVRRGIFSASVTMKVIEEKKEVTIVHENNEGRRLLITGNPILDSNGNISKIITTSRDITELTSLQKQLDRMQLKLEDIQIPEYGIIAQSPAMASVLQLAQRLSRIDAIVLITGESGVGKGLLARYIHESGTRSDGPFIQVNCGAIPESLIESELFGYEKGAFTGSSQEGKKGLFEAAENGTIFLDEISELPLNMQVKLLQVIQDRVITHVGGVKGIPVNARIISATNKDLQTLVKRKEFREDLFYRLNVVPVTVPSLRERSEDLLPLITSNLKKFNLEMDEQKTFDAEALTILMNYSWPGNVRELQNIIERLVITTKDDLITPDNLPAFIQKSISHEPVSSLKAAVEKTEEQVLREAASKYGSTRAVAKALDISQPTAVRKLNKYGIVTHSDM